MTLLETADWSGNIYTGSWQPGGGGSAPVVEPATGDLLGEYGLASVADVQAAAARAATAQREWAARGPFERAQILRTAAEVFQKNADEIIAWTVREGGATFPKAAFELGTAVAECVEAAALATAPYGQLLQSPLPRLSVERRVPVGLVTVISPFNFPLELSMRSIAPALALGNAVLLKPDPRTTVCGGFLLARVFEEAGLPAGLLQVLPGGAEVGGALIDQPGVRVVSFTGSTPAGRAIAARAAQTLTRTHLELGGNSAFVVLADANVAAAASCGAFGNWMHSGQVCMAVGRHLVHESIYDDYVALLAAKAEAIPVGDGFRDNVALGPLIDQKQLDHCKDLVDRSIAAGARLVAGGTSEGLFYRPTVLADCDETTPAYNEEVFGPVASVRKFSDIEEVIGLANDTDFGLSLGIITNDFAAAFRIADQVRVGHVHINDQTINDDPNSPFGGVGSSGWSRIGGATANLDGFTETQWITIRSTPATYPF
jgi:benzaldehyde dehydrogenase (NAD)